MNKTLETYAREKIKEMLANLTEKNHMIFKKMYSSGDLTLDINLVVDKMEVEKLDWALTQCQNSINKKEKNDECKR